MQFIAKVVLTNTLEIDPDAWYIKKFSTKLYNVDAVHDLKGHPTSTTDLVSTVMTIRGSVSMLLIYNLGRRWVMQTSLM